MKTEPISFRSKASILKTLDDIAKVNGTTRTDEIERYIEDGIKRSMEGLKKKSAWYVLMMLLVSLFGLQVWLSICCL